MRLTVDYPAECRYIWDRSLPQIPCNWTIYHIKPERSREVKRLMTDNQYFTYAVGTSSTPFQTPVRLYMAVKQTRLPYLVLSMIRHLCRPMSRWTTWGLRSSLTSKKQRVLNQLYWQGSVEWCLDPLSFCSSLSIVDRCTGRYNGNLTLYSR